MESSRPPWDTRPLRRHLRSNRASAVVLSCPDSCSRPERAGAETTGVPSAAAVEGRGGGVDAVEETPDLPERTILVKAPVCLADVEPAAILECLSMTALTVVDACDQGAASGRGAVQTARAAGAEVLAAPGAVAAGWSGPVVRGDAVPVPRRVLLGRAEELEEMVSRPQERLTAAVRALCPGPPTAALAGMSGDALRLQAPGCHGDGLCVRACPQEALARRVDGDGARRFVLVLDPGLCDGCGECVQACPHRALRDLGQLSWAEVLAGPMVLRSGLIGDCERCGAPVRGSQPLCHVCVERDRDPFGVCPPPGFVLDEQTGGLRREGDVSGVGAGCSPVGWSA
ncbi:4Fe-4S binding protein [Austwickia chelonae]|uniref:4Fe-4S binding protein n=1 Tax=Austwickia chelonae TaxID=100225 RepID=UPI0013C2BBDC|nr:4Fe-4S binding protein [Austwickia chelonae]